MGFLCPLIFWAVTANAEVIFSDNFDGPNTDLNSASPDVSLNGATWVASPAFNRDGSVDPAAGASATLAFTPASGRIYTFEASLRGVTSAAGINDWVGFGFANGQSALSGSTRRLLTGDVVGRAWAFVRGSGSSSTNMAYLGNSAVATNPGLASGAVWSGTWTSGGDIDVGVVLDTAADTGSWNATWYAKRPPDSAFTLIRSKTNLIDESINSVGFSVSNTRVDCSMTSFTLVSDAPPPLSRRPIPTPTPTVWTIPGKSSTSGKVPANRMPPSSPNTGETATPTPTVLTISRNRRPAPRPSTPTTSLKPVSCLYPMVFPPPMKTATRAPASTPFPSAKTTFLPSATFNSSPSTGAIANRSATLTTTMSPSRAAG